MMNVTTLELPREFFKVESGSFRLVRRGSHFQSQFTPNISVGAADFMQWSCELTLTIQERGRGWQRLESFFARVHGQGFAFTLYDPSRQLPLGAGAGFDPASADVIITDPDTSEHTIVGGFKEGGTIAYVKTAAERYANDVIVKGLPVSQTVMKAGDLFSLGGNLYQMRGDAVSDANGDARFSFDWRLWKPALVNDPIYLRCPTGRFVTIDPDTGSVNKLPANLADGAKIMALEMPYFT